MANPTWRKVNWFAAFSGIGKQQTALGQFLADADIDTRDKCEMEINENITRSEERSCNDVDVVGRPVRRRWVEIRLTYSRLTPQILARFAAYMQGVVQPPTGTSINEIQTISRSGTVSSGTFTLALTLESRTGISKPIAWNATAAQIQAALVNPASSIGRMVKIGDVVVSGDWTTGIVLTFGGRLGKANLPMLVVAATVGGGGSVVAAQTTQGDNYLHAIERSSDFSKPLFSFATGDINKSVAVRKYGDATVNSLDIVNNLDQGNVTATIVVTASYYPDLSTGFTVPPCINVPPLKSTDVKVEINNNFETRDVVNQTVSLNDNVDANANFEFDDVDFSLETERGNQPTQTITAEIYGGENSNIYALAEQAATDTPTQATVEYITHYGNPGNRFSVIGEETFVAFQNTRDGFAGPLSKKTTKINAEPWGVTGNPLRYEAHLSQSQSFLTM